MCLAYKSKNIIGSEGEEEYAASPPPPKICLFGISISWAEGNQDPTDSGKAFYLSVNCIKERGKKKKKDRGEGVCVPGRELWPQLTFYI